MASDVTVEVDRFGDSLEEIFGDISTVAEEALEAAVSSGIKTSAKAWRKNAASSFKGDKYKRSIRSRVVKSARKPNATAYSTMPGLPHLLEKGHAKMGGGSVPGREHIANAADDGFEDAWETLQRELDSSL